MQLYFCHDYSSLLNNLKDSAFCHKLTDVCAGYALLSCEQSPLQDFCWGGFSPWGPPYSLHVSLRMDPRTGLWKRMRNIIMCCPTQFKRHDLILKELSTCKSLLSWKVWEGGCCRTICWKNRHTYAYWLILNARGRLQHISKNPS